MKNKLTDIFKSDKDAEAYALLMRQLPNSTEETDEESEKMYEEVAEVQDLLAEINQPKLYANQ